MMNWISVEEPKTYEDLLEKIAPGVCLPELFEVTDIIERMKKVLHVEKFLHNSF